MKKYSKIISNRNTRRNRSPRPINAFIDIFEESYNALKELSELEVSNNTMNIIKRSNVINIVTAVEVYFKDMLDSIFRMIKPSVYEGKLRQIHDVTYKIDDLILFTRENIHPMELIINSQNFQNIDNIERVFKVIMGKSLISSVLGIKYRLKNNPSIEYSFSEEDIKNVKEIINIRHELIHNLHKESNLLLQEMESLMDSVLSFIMASDLIFSEFISKNLDDELQKDKKNS